MPYDETQLRNVRKFLEKESVLGNIKIGFHYMRNQDELFSLLRSINIKKGWFTSPRQFLRDTITMNQAAYDIVSELVCLHGVYNGHLFYCDAHGQKSDPQIYLQSEIMYSFENLEVAEIFINELGQGFT